MSENSSAYTSNSSIPHYASCHHQGTETDAYNVPEYSHVNYP